VAKQRRREWHFTGLMIPAAFAARFIKTCRRVAPPVWMVKLRLTTTTANNVQWSITTRLLTNAKGGGRA